MANYFTNIISILGTQEEKKQVIDLIKDEHQNYGYPDFGIDFNRVAPTPNEKLFKTLLPLSGERSVSNLIVNWRYENWGTKWNPTFARFIDDNTFAFSTAGGEVIPIVQKLSAKYKKPKFQICWSDEGNPGYYQGVLRYKAGKLQYEYVPSNGSINANKLHALIENWMIDKINEAVKGIFK